MLTGLISHGSVHCVAHVGQKNSKTTKMSQFIPNLHILGGSCAHPPLLIWSKFDRKQQTHGLCLYAEFHLNMFVVSSSKEEKPQFLIFWGYCIQQPLPKTAKLGMLMQTHGLSLQVKFRLEQFIVSVHSSMPNFTPIAATYRPCRAKNPKIAE